YCTRLLADFGAEVIKVQSAEIGRAESVPGYNNYYNRNKLGVSIDMSTEKGREICKRLISVSDVVVENFSARVLRQWGLDWENARKIRPDIIVVSMAGMGHSGPMRDYVSFGPTLHAMTGLTSLGSFSRERPLGYGYSYADHVGGITGAMGVLQALNFRLRTGQGQFVDVAQLEGTAALLSTALLECTINGKPPGPIGNRLHNPAATPHDVYPCKGVDRWVAITVFSEEEWRSFCGVVGEVSWLSDSRFATALSRRQNADELDKLISEWTRRHTAEEVMGLLQRAGVPAGVVQDAEDLIEHDPQIKARGFWVEADHPEAGKTRLDRSPINFSETPFQVQRAAPLPGQHNNYVFGEILGMSAEEIARLTEEGVLQ
ncbi:MAG: CoA transferase, partial [Dehalococcoidia bacterium]|nr:CoA transferase [Dehalococcoidia bacterium]